MVSVNPTSLIEPLRPLQQSRHRLGPIAASVDSPPPRAAASAVVTSRRPRRLPPLARPPRLPPPAPTPPPSFPRETAAAPSSPRAASARERRVPLAGALTSRRRPSIAPPLVSHCIDAGAAFTCLGQGETGSPGRRPNIAPPPSSRRPNIVPHPSFHRTGAAFLPLRRRRRRLHLLRPGRDGLPGRRPGPSVGEAVHRRLDALRRAIRAACALALHRSVVLLGDGHAGSPQPHSAESTSIGVAALPSTASNLLCISRRRRTANSRCYFLLLTRWRLLRCQLDSIGGALPNWWPEEGS